MRAYYYQADIYCAPCAHKIMAGLEAPEDDIASSDDYPVGPYMDGGGEADYPQHCGSCDEFLCNPLTDHGREYVLNAVREGVAPDEWRAYYTMTL